MKAVTASKYKAYGLFCLRQSATVRRNPVVFGVRFDGIRHAIGGISTLSGVLKMPLTDTAIRCAKPLAKPFRTADSAGLYLEVSPSGWKLWRFNQLLCIARFCEYQYMDSPVR